MFALKIEETDKKEGKMKEYFTRSAYVRTFGGKESPFTCTAPSPFTMCQSADLIRAKSLFRTSLSSLVPPQPPEGVSWNNSRQLVHTLVANPGSCSMKTSSQLCNRTGRDRDIKAKLLSSGVEHCIQMKVEDRERERGQQGALST